MASIVSWQPHESSSLAIRHLMEGACVALPSEATYELVASALQPQAVARLAAFGQPALIVTDDAELTDWLPLLEGAAGRIFRKMGPGPITLDAGAGFATGLWSRLPEAVQQQTVRAGHLRVRYPAHPCWRELKAFGLPLVSVSIPGGVSADEAVRLVGAQAACVVDAGSTSCARPPSLVRAVGRRISVVQEGAVTAQQIDELALCRIVFICTGNTCRSPMAQVLCVKLLAEALGCAPGELKQRGFSVQSAGLAAMMGAEASADAVRVASDLGADLAQHCSRLVTLEMLQWADFLFGMTAGHCWTLESIPASMPAPRRLAPDGGDIADPIGGALSDYQTCAHQILECLQQRLPELLES